MPLPTRKIGQDDVAAVGLGLMGISAFYGQIESDEERFKVLDTALEIGATNWDTADVYGDSEDMIGKWFKRTGKRDEIFLATKFGFRKDWSICGTPEYVKEAAAKSLERLQTDKIDLYYLHRPDTKTPIEKTVSAMAELVKEGKVKYLGLSEVSEATLRRAHKVHPISALQVEYSPFFLDIEDERTNLLKTCKELGIAVIAYSPLGRGLATGTYRSKEDFEEGDARRNLPKFTDENFPSIIALVDDLKAIGEKHGATPSQVVLAWLLAQSPEIIPIPGTKKIKYLKENVNALDVKLGEEEIAEIRRLVNRANSTIVGERYAPGSINLVMVDTPPL